MLFTERQIPRAAVGGDSSPGHWFAVGHRMDVKISTGHRIVTGDARTEVWITVSPTSVSWKH